MRGKSGGKRKCEPEGRFGEKASHNPRFEPGEKRKHVAGEFTCDRDAKKTKLGSYSGKGDSPGRKRQRGV